MKKLLLAASVICLLIAFSAFLPSVKEHKVRDTEYDYWYYISNNHVTGIFDYDKKESQVVGSAPCPDDGDVVCLLGTDEVLSVNQEIDPGEYELDQLIAYDDSK